MPENKELNQEQLEKVSGGGSCASPDHLPASHGAHVYAKSLYEHKDIYINKKFYCVEDFNDNHYMVVTLKDVSKGGLGIYETVYVHEIHGDFETSRTTKFSVGGTYTILDTFITMYRYEVGYEATV